MVEDPADHEKDIEVLQGDGLIVIFVVSGEYEWYNKNFVPPTAYWQT